MALSKKAIEATRAAYKKGRITCHGVGATWTHKGFV